VNIRSLRKNWDQFTQQLKKLKIEWEVIILSEINIKKEEIELYTLSGYTNKTLTREETRRGGGLMLFIKNTLEAEVRKVEAGENNVLEILISEENNKDKKEKNIQIIAAYRKPTTNKKDFAKKIKERIENNLQIWKYQMIVGDINIDILEKDDESEDNYEQNSIDYYENTMASLGFDCKINSPTREEVVLKKGNKIVQSSCIDHIYIKCHKGESAGGVLTEKISDHYCTMGWMWNSNNKLSKSNEEENVESYSRLNNLAIIQELNKVNWENLNELNEPEDIYTAILDQINIIYSNNRVKIKKNKKIENKQKDQIGLQKN